MVGIAEEECILLRTVAVVAKRETERLFPVVKLSGAVAVAPQARPLLGFGGPALVTLVPPQGGC